MICGGLLKKMESKICAMCDAMSSQTLLLGRNGRGVLIGGFCEFWSPGRIWWLLTNFGFFWTPGDVYGMAATFR